MKTDFAGDLLALLPLPLCLAPHLGFEAAKAFHVLKVVRLKSACDKIDTKTYLRVIATSYERLRGKSHSQKSASILNDLTYSFYIIKLLIVSLSLSFFFGVAWHICICQIPSSQFRTEFDLPSMSVWRQIILLSYFTFTTLTTVGLGDFYALTDYERIANIILMLCGACFASYFMEGLLLRHAKHSRFEKDFENSGKLFQFLGTLERFNGHKKLDTKFVKCMENYFTYRWEANKNQILESLSSVSILDQIPSEGQNKIFSEFLFKDFIRLYNRYFEAVRQINVDTSRIKLIAKIRAHQM